MARFDADVRAAFAGRISGTTYDAGRSVVIVHVIGDLSEADRALLQTVIDTHDPDALTDDQLAAAKVTATLEEADAQSAAIPGWATWTEAEVLAWIDANVQADTGTKTAMKAMGRMLVALRNKNWPYLQA